VDFTWNNNHILVIIIFENIIYDNYIFIFKLFLDGLMNDDEIDKWYHLCQFHMCFIFPKNKLKFCFIRPSYFFTQETIMSQKVEILI